MTGAQQRLAEVRTAISDVLTKGQRLRRADREILRAELASLRMMEKQYADEVAVEERRRRSRVMRLYHSGKGI